MKLVDSHCHLNSVNSNLLEENFLYVNKIILGGVSPAEWIQQIRCRNKYPQQVFLSFGLHPWYVSESDKKSLEKDFSRLRKQALQAHLIGETGLDAHGKWNQALRNQILLFEKHIELASEVQKPLVIHCVKAEQDILRILKKSPAKYGGMIHSFNGTWQQAQAFVDLGFYISFGPLSLKNTSSTFLEVIHNISLDHLLLESDAPDQASNSRILLDIASNIAKKRNIDSDIIIGVNYTNFHKLLGGNHGMDADSDGVDVT